MPVLSKLPRFTAPLVDQEFFPRRPKSESTLPGEFVLARLVISGDPVS